MHRKITRATVQFCVVVLISISAGVASAQTKVACVGDSITALPSSWCGTLSTKLGSDYDVQNFGVSGTNLAKDVAQPYWDSAQYGPSHSFAPNIVIIMLGTNDSFDRSWPQAESHFVADYEELLDTYTSLASKPKPYIIIPTPIGTSPFGHSGELLESEVIPLIKQVAMTKMVPTIDGFTLFGGAMFDTSLYSASDQVHPNAQGQEKLGNEVYRVLMETGALGGPVTAGSGATAGAGGMAGSMAAAGAGGMIGGIAGAGGAAGTAPTTGGAGSASPSGAAGGGAATGASGSTGSRANVGGSPSAAGAPGGGANAGSNATTGVNSVQAAGSVAPPVTPPTSGDDGGCQTAGNSTSSSGPTALLLLLLGIALRSRKSIPCGTRGRQAARMAK